MPQIFNASIGWLVLALIYGAVGRELWRTLRGGDPGPSY